MTDGRGVETGGTYSLVVDVTPGVDIEVGGLGGVTFPAGWYAYTGSAQGPGGFARVRRHREVAAGERETRHWHLDYLLGQPAATLDLVVGNAGVDEECRVARAIKGRPIPAFGASDCSCGSHLTFAPRRQHLLATVTRAHRAARASRD